MEQLTYFLFIFLHAPLSKSIKREKREGVDSEEGRERERQIDRERKRPTKRPWAYQITLKYYVTLNRILFFFFLDFSPGLTNAKTFLVTNNSIKTTMPFLIKGII